MSDDTPRVYRGLTRRTRWLLSRQEDYDVDFKRTVSAIDQGDLVAFANSPTGGTLLVGVDEGKGPDGRQCGVVVGCAVGDREKLLLQNKATDCVPPVKLEIFIENTGRNPIFRLEIPSGLDKPYCTRRGTYKIRGDGRTDAIFPVRLLAIFMENESERFRQRFRQATGQLQGGKGTVDPELINDLAGLEERLNTMLGRILATAAEAEHESSQAKWYSDEALELLRTSDKRLQRLALTMRDLHDRVELLMERDGMMAALEDRRRREVHAFLSTMGPSSAERLMLAARAQFPHLPRQQLGRWVNEMLETRPRRD
jgi:ATP-dependent DNA helicase RecG